jgi:putative DNA modification/repair radical SAM protein
VPGAGGQDEVAGDFCGAGRRVPMDLERKLEVLAGSAKYDVCAPSCGGSKQTSWHKQPGRLGRVESLPITHAVLPDGRTVSLFKVLQSNACERSCYYCANRAQANCPRTTFQPEELSRLFFEFYRRNYVEGLFLSSGIVRSPDYTMELMLRTVELLRTRYQFAGYVHLKTLPGASPHLIERAGDLADRTSVNLEAPRQEHLTTIAPEKRLTEHVLAPMRVISRVQAAGHFPAGMTTQLVVGAAQETDREILASIDWLYRNLHLRRAYYSAFSPVPGTPLESRPPTPLLREHRLYQSDWLLKFYGFRFEELPFERSGNLPLDADPKHAWAGLHPELFPVEVNSAALEQLLRVPGIGPRSAQRISRARSERKLHSLDELRNIGVVVKRARNFLTLSGRFFPATVREKPKQLALFDSTFAK